VTFSCTVGPWCHLGKALGISPAPSAGSGKGLPELGLLPPVEAQVDAETGLDTAL
jgi:hypothetical protein